MVPRNMTRWISRHLMFVVIMLMVDGSMSQCPEQPTQDALDDALISQSIGAPVEKLLAWQIPALDDIEGSVLPPDASNTAVQRTTDKRNWVWGAMMIGMAQWAQVSNNASLWEWLQATAEREEYMLGDRLYHADDHAVGQVYYALHFQQSVPYATAMSPTQTSFDAILAAPASDVALDFSVEGTDEDDDAGYSPLCLKRWCWCDALFMAPPTWIALATASGDSQYLEFSETEFWATHEYLYRPLPDLAPSAGLFLRDSRYFENILDDEGRQIFWGRGNGWVYAGLTAILDLLPPSHPTLDRYMELFQNMSTALVEVQRPPGDPLAGFWGPSLLAHDLFPFPEASGTAFFVAGLAWGVRKGFLDGPTYTEAARAGWEALLTVQRADGAIGSVQQIGSEPGEVEENSTQLYGTGAFLSAAANMLQLEVCATTAAAPTGVPSPGAAVQPSSTSGVAESPSSSPEAVVGQDALPGTTSGEPVTEAGSRDAEVEASELTSVAHGGTAMVPEMPTIVACAVGVAMLFAR